MNFEGLLQETETALRTGRSDLARKSLLKIKGKVLPRSKARHFATLARRAGMMTLALQIMSPIVRPKVKIEVPATPEEIATYGLILLGLGAIQECSAILNSTDQTIPDVLLAQAFTAIKTWDYPKAIVLLEKYITSGQATDYLKMVAKVNLAASRIAIGEPQQLETGGQLVQEILAVTAKEGWTLLQTNAHELSIQISIQNRDWATCDRLLTTSSPTDSSLFLQKWRAVSEVLRNTKSQEGLLRLNDVRKRAVDEGHWETVRDCDFHESLATRNSEQALRVYFGTPFQTYRKRLCDSTADWLMIPETYSHQFAPIAKGDASRVFLLSEGYEVGNRKLQLPVGKSMHMALQILSSDFYRPFSVGSLFSEVFKGEHFNPTSSPRRVAFLIHRLRTWFEENSVPLDIVSNRDGYRLFATAAYVFELSSRQVDATNGNLRLLDRLKNHFKNSERSELSGHEIAIALETSDRSARYFLKWAVENNLVSRMGSGRSIRYRI